MTNKEILRQEIIDCLEFEIKCLQKALKQEYSKVKLNEEYILSKEDRLCYTRIELEKIKSRRVNTKQYYGDLEHELAEEGLLQMLYE